jgi:hypothetical protein
MVQLSDTRYKYRYLWINLVSFFAITLCVPSQWVFIVVYFVIDSVRKLLLHPRIYRFTCVHRLCKKCVEGILCKVQALHRNKLVSFEYFQDMEQASVVTNFWSWMYMYFRSLRQNIAIMYSQLVFGETFALFNLLSLCILLLYLGTLLWVIIVRYRNFYQKVGFCCFLACYRNNSAPFLVSLGKPWLWPAL